MSVAVKVVTLETTCIMSRIPKARSAASMRYGTGASRAASRSVVKTSEDMSRVSPYNALREDETSDFVLASLGLKGVGGDILNNALHGLMSIHIANAKKLLSSSPRMALPSIG